MSPWIERLLAGGGFALLLAFLLLRVGQAHEREQGLAAFSNAYVESTASASASSAWSPPPTTSRLPDQSLWSEARIAAYEESLEAVDSLPLAVLRIERLDIEVPVYNGTDEAVLNRGAGRIVGTARVGEAGNLGIAAHRDGFFRPLKDIELGDVLHLQTPDGAREYVVESTTIVTPDDVTVLEPTDSPVITLVTCYPFYFVGSAPERFIVRARANVETPTNDEGTS